MRPRHARRLGAVGITAALMMTAACGGGGDSAPTTEATTTTTATTTTSTTTTTTTVPPTTEESTTTTEAPVEERMPLTGIPVEDPALAARAALVVKIDNHPQARPQEGLNEADIVFEENVEGLTRFAAVFQSRDAVPVGPIRSGRTQDVDMLGSLNAPLFAWSGGNPTVTQAIRDSDLYDIGALTKGVKGYYRDKRGRRVDTEHTLFASTVTLRENAPADRPTPPQQFEYRTDATPVQGAEAAGVNLSMDGVRVGWTWAPVIGGYLRTQDGRSHETTGGQVAASNVVVLEVEYRPSRAQANSPEAQTVGSGRVFVYTGGHLIEGTWSRASRTATYALTDAAGQPILLTPGRTWVELARSGSIATVGGPVGG